jgi:hypothetical protein
VQEVKGDCRLFFVLLVVAAVALVLYQVQVLDVHPINHVADELIHF